MSKWIAISRNKHAESRWQPRRGYGFAASQQVVEILVPELGQLLPHYALGFVKHEGSYQAVALLGVGGERNFYVGPGDKWLATYVPAVMRGYPFTLATNENDPDKRVFCVEEQHLRSGEDTFPLFKEDGELSELVERSLSFLQNCDQGRAHTVAACQRLADAGIIEEWPMKVNRPEGEEPLNIEGLYRISEERLNALEPSVLSDLRQNGALMLAYAQLFSMHQVDQLSERSRYLEGQSRTGSVDNLFQDDDVLNFDALNDDTPKTH